MMERRHNHPHQLELKLYQKPYFCDGCKEPGFGSRYRCDMCDYDLHQDCKFPLSSTTSHPFFKNSVFRFYETPQRKCHCSIAIRRCDACGRSIDGFNYHCKEKGWDLHPCCKNLEQKLSIDAVRFKLLDKVRGKCLWCGEKKITHSISGIRGWSYVSECGEYNLHVFCVTEMVSDAVRKMNRSGKASENKNRALFQEKIELPIYPRYIRKKSSNMYWKIAKVLFDTIISVLLGSPSTAISLIINSLS